MKYTLAGICVIGLVFVMIVGCGGEGRKEKDDYVEIKEGKLCLIDSYESTYGGYSESSYTISGKDLKEMVRFIRTQRVKGEVLRQSSSWYSENGEPKRYWEQFEENDVEERVNGYTKIWRKWYKNEDIILYDKPINRKEKWKTKKDTIERRGKEMFSEDYI